MSSNETDPPAAPQEAGTGQPGGEASPGNGAAPPGRERADQDRAAGAAGGRAGSFGAAAASAAEAARGGASAAVQRAAPVVRDAAAGFTRWLVSISWWKFFLLSMLMLACTGIAYSLFASKDKDSWDWDQGDIDVHVHVVPLADGTMRIESAEGSHPRSVLVQPGRGAGKPQSGRSEDDVLLRIEGDDKNHPAVRIDRQGVRILADKEDGGKASVVIDKSGVRIENVPATAKDAQDAGAGKAASTGGAKAPQGSISQAIVPDSEQVADAVEAARDGIETILQDEVDRKLVAHQLHDRHDRGNGLTGLAVLLIIVSVILKVALGSKTRAESRARQASEVAAQEGLKRQLAEAQVKMMQAQVEPHFLFNTLASVDYLIETDPARASRMQKNLIQYLRAALPQMREGASTLGREIVQCRSYLEILKVRMDERLHFSINVPQALQAAEFPPMMLLTLVENAIKHGLEPKPEGGSLSVSATVADHCLQVSVADSGMGFGVAARGGTGVGLTNVRERLQALYGAAARLQIEANADGGTIATIFVPYRVSPAGAGQPAAAPAGSVGGLAAAAGGASQ